MIEPIRMIIKFHKIFIVEVNASFILFSRYLFKLQEFPSGFPPSQVVEVDGFECSVEGCQNRNCTHEILAVMNYLPDWVEPHMVYSDGAIEKKQILGHGQYGTVHQGLFHNGNAV